MKKLFEEYGDVLLTAVIVLIVIGLSITVALNISNLSIDVTKKDENKIINNTVDEIIPETTTIRKYSKFVFVYPDSNEGCAGKTDKYDIITLSVKNTETEDEYVVSNSENSCQSKLVLPSGTYKITQTEIQIEKTYDKEVSQTFSVALPPTVDEVEVKISRITEKPLDVSTEEYFPQTIDSISVNGVSIDFNKVGQASKPIGAGGTYDLNKALKEQQAIDATNDGGYSIIGGASEEDYWN